MKENKISEALEKIIWNIIGFVVTFFTGIFCFLLYNRRTVDRNRNDNNSLADRAEQQRQANSRLEDRIEQQQSDNRTASDRATETIETIKQIREKQKILDDN